MQVGSQVYLSHLVSCTMSAADKAELVVRFECHVVHHFVSSVTLFIIFFLFSFAYLTTPLSLWAIIHKPPAPLCTDVLAACPHRRPRPPPPRFRRHPILFRALSSPIDGRSTARSPMGVS